MPRRRTSHYHRAPVDAVVSCSAATSHRSRVGSPLRATASSSLSPAAESSALSLCRRAVELVSVVTPQRRYCRRRSRAELCPSSTSNTTKRGRRCCCRCSPKVLSRSISSPSGPRASTEAVVGSGVGHVQLESATKG